MPDAAARPFFVCASEMPPRYRVPEPKRVQRIIFPSSEIDFDECNWRLDGAPLAHYDHVFVPSPVAAESTLGQYPRNGATTALRFKEVLRVRLIELSPQIVPPNGIRPPSSRQLIANLPPMASQLHSCWGAGLQRVEVAGEVNEHWVRDSTRLFLSNFRKEDVVCHPGFLP